MPSTPIADQSAGSFQLYSSGSTGRPKGLRHPSPRVAFDAVDPMTTMLMERFGYREDSVFIAPGPLSHSLTLVSASLAHRVGATVVQMSRFDPKSFLSQVEKYRVSISQMVPMMFVRLLKMPQAERKAFDVSSLRSIFHATAPCAPAIKRAMIEWWGPILYDFYSGTEGLGGTIISSQEWLERPGSVGKPLWGTPHICSDDGRELPPGQIGAIYFDGPSQVEVLNNPAKTAEMRHPVHKSWATYGDVGRLDDEGYLYLTDRATFVVQSGEHRLYPQGTEDVLIAHPKLADAAVFGVPDAARGQQLVAVVQPLDAFEAGPSLAQELSAWCRARLEPERCPASIEFARALPRSESGKLYKRLLRDRWIRERA
jgi:acyl-coenzyme A synthetase/AMP-(fatty) acid ligase